MSTTTTRNALVKPAYSDAADIAIVNTNMDTIDASFAKCNWAGAVAPVAANDSSQGYSIGSLWFDTTNHKLYIAESVGVGATVWRWIYAGGSTNALLADGSVALTGNWTTNTKNITTTGTLTGNQVASTVATGTAPLVVASTTQVANLNCASLNGIADTGFVKQTLADAKGDMIVATANDTWARQAAGVDGECLIASATATNGIEYIKMGTGANRNLLINGSFDVNQHGLATVTSSTVPINSDDTYVIDQWTLLSDGNNIMNIWPSTAGAPKRGGMVGLQTQTANKKAGMIQFLEQKQCYAAIGDVVSLRFYAFTPAAHPNANIMAGVLSWSSTADSLTSDVVSAWNATNNAPTLIANWTFENVPARLALVNDTWTEYKIENIAIDTASTTNIAVFIWLDDTDSTSGDLVYFSGVQLNIGAKCLPWSSKGYAEEVMACNRYYKVVNGGAGAYGHFGLGLAYDTQYLYCEQWHPTRWFKTAAAPTMIATITCLPGGAILDTVNTECLLETNVLKYGDNGKAFTAGVSYIILDSSTGTARVYVESRL